jgi:virginiamycin A acetyltransferase
MTIQIAESARISTLVDIEDCFPSFCTVVGHHSFIGSLVKSKPVGGSRDLIIEDHVFNNSGCMLCKGNRTRIGINVAVAANRTFVPVNHAYKDKLQIILKQGILPKKVSIVVEDVFWIGANCVLLDGAIPRWVCVVDADSVVQEQLAYYSFYTGYLSCILGVQK